MPTPIVHLCAAKKLLEEPGNYKINNIPAFYLGAIAPDSPYLVPTYYDVDGKYDEYAAAHLLKSDFESWKKTVRDFIESNRPQNNFDFYFGCGIHILTDICWKETVLPDIREKYERENPSGSSEKFREIYYSDIELLDFDLYEKYELKSAIWNYLSDCPAVGINGMVKSDEVDIWRVNTLRLFDGKINAHKPTEYFYLDNVVNFIKNIKKYI